MFKDALEACEKQGALNKFRIESLDKLINLYSIQNKYVLAEPYFKQSLVLISKSRGSGSKEYAHALMRHGQLLRKLNRKDEAMDEEEKAENILAKFISSPDSGSGGSAQQEANDPSATRRGSIYQRARAAQSGFTDAANQAINSPD